MDIDFRPLRNIGAEVLGLDLGRPIDSATRACLYRAWLDHGVLLFRGLGVDVETHLALSRCFGDLEEHVLKSLLVGDSKELIEVSRGGTPMGPSYYVGGRLLCGYLFWHQDLAYTPSICKGGILRMVKAPASGGETGWVDTALAYDALPAATRERIEGLEVRHRLRCEMDSAPFGVDRSMRRASIQEAPYDMPSFPDLPDVVHPLVSTHPETGRKSLGISPLSLVDVIGMPREDSDELLAGLVAHALREEFMLVHRWGVDDLVLWDNRRTIHAVFGHPYGQDRVAHRTTLAGGLNSGRIHV
ncbi:MAG: TauD/TfdA dioxygenase family protein [Gammaproteobacteria bacterium]